MTDPLKVGVAKNLASFRVDYFLNLLIFKGFSPDSPLGFAVKIVVLPRN